MLTITTSGGQPLAHIHTKTMKTIMTESPIETALSKVYPRRVPKVADGGPGWIMCAPVISTRHITEGDGEILRDYGQDEGEALAMLNSGSGHILRIEEDDSHYDAYSQPFCDLMKALTALGYEYVRIDGMGDEIPGLPTFEW